MRLPDLAKVAQDLAAQEAQVPGLRPGCQARIVWAGDSARQTDLCMIYIHGFSASPQEIRPLPDLVARDLRANLLFARLTGHGQDGAAMAQATLADWRADVARAMQIGQTLGRRIVIMGCSTGATLATLALAEGAQAAAIVHVSPNFGLRARMAQRLLDLPGARHWIKYVAGSQRSFPPINAAHAAYWTVRYPTDAVHPMADALRALRRADLGRIMVPALFCYAADDKVVDARKTADIANRWGGPSTTVALIPTAQDDPMCHVMAGDVFSPGQTKPLAGQIIRWLDDHL